MGNFCFHTSSTSNHHQ
uniref:Uncharacterized protein n=1 Tax=Arundo donax TaxID=35708 RepID=A0A0A9BQ97_ARUDO